MSDATSEPPLAAAADDEPLPPPPSVEAQPAPATNDTSTAVGDDEIELHPLEVANKSPAASEEDAESLPPSTRARATGRRPSQLEVTQELSDAYNKEANPSAEDISALAQRTGLSEQQVSTFFANKRARDRAAEAKAEAVGAAVAAAAVPLAPSSQVDDVLTAITNEDGGLADPENAQQLVKLMQMQLNMDDQLLLLAVILATKSFACRKRLLELGGLPPICEWLAAAKRDNKVPLQKELLRVLECLPIKVEQLRATSAGKVVKGLKTSTDPDVRLRADRLVAVWMSLVAAVDPGAAAAPSVVNPSSSSGEKRAHDTAPTHTPTPMDADAARKRAAPAPVPAGGAASGATSKASAAVAVAKKPRLEDAAAAPAKKPPAPTPAPAPKPKPEALKPKVVSATTTLAANDDFDVLTKKKSIVPEHLKKPAARTALLIEGDDKKKDEARPAKDAASSFTSKPISADEIRKEKQRQKALGVDKAEPRLESKPGQGAAVAAQLGRIVAAVASGSLTSSDPLAAADAAAASASASTAAAAPSVPSVPSLNPASAAPAAAAKVEEAAAATVAQGKGKPKKRLTWADHHGAPLKRIKTFKKDKPDFSPEAQQAPNRDAFVKAAHMEHQREKENLLKEKKAHTLDLKVTIAWFRPRPLQLADPQPVADTPEARAQKERERAILLDMQAFRADRTIDMSKVPDTPLEPEPEPANDDAKVVVIPADDQAAAVVADPNAAAAAAAGLAPNLLSLANLHTVLSQMPGQPVAAPPPPAPVMPMAMPPMDASMLVHALASLVGAGAPPPAVAHPMPPQYYGPPGGFSPAPNAPHMQGPPPGYNRDRDRERGVDPSPDLLARRHNILCQYFLKGDCKYGARCHFSHTPSEDDIKNAKRKRGGR